jgi:hypothetical protein
MPLLLAQPGAAGQSARTRPERVLALDCDLEYQDWVSIVNRIPGPFEVGVAFQPDMARESG